MTLRLDPRRNKPHRSQNRPLSCATAISRHVMFSNFARTVLSDPSGARSARSSQHREEVSNTSMRRTEALDSVNPRKCRARESQVELSLTEQRRHLIAVPQGRVLVIQEPCAEGWGQRVKIYIRDLCKPEPSPGRLSFAVPCRT